MEKFEERVLLAIGPDLLSVHTNDGDMVGGGEILNIAPQALTLEFDEGIDPTTFGGIEIVRSGPDGTLDTPDDVTVTPGFVGLNLPDSDNEVLLRFAETLPDDTYRMTFVGTGADPLRGISGDAFNGGADLSLQLELDLGARVVAVVPQPTSRDGGGNLQQARDQIVVHFNDDDLNVASAQDVNFYQLIFTNDTATNADDVRHLPNSVVYDATSNTATLTFADDLDSLGGLGTYRLRVGNDDPLPVAPDLTPVGGDPGSSFDTAHQIATLDDATRVITEEIGGVAFNLTLPGGIDEPGHRDIPPQSHINADADDTPGISELFYNFQDLYGFDPEGNPLFNVITENQKDRAREVFEFYGDLAGVQFVESADLGFTIVTGDLRAISPNVPTGPGGVIGIAGDTINPNDPLDPLDDTLFLSRVAIMDAAEDWGESEFGGGWFRTALHEIGHLLGQGHTDELPPLTIQNDDIGQVPGGAFVEPVFPGDHDIVHLQHLFRPESIDVDIYEFTVLTPGVFSAEVIAERLPDSSHLDSALALYDSSGNLIARNDDYFSEDSFLELELTQSGSYRIAVMSTGLVDLNPTIENSGFGGTTEGAYELRLNFDGPAANELLDATGIVLDGDADGDPGGVFNFWFNVADDANTLFVDKASNVGGTPDGSLSDPYLNIDDALAVAVEGDIVRIVGNGGGDDDVVTLDDNEAYEIGLDNFGAALTDGATLNVPQGVTVMIDAGAIFKLQDANITVGSDTQGVDRSGAALQVLGTPEASAYFTSWNDEATGLDTSPGTTSPLAGDWGGLVFRNDVDRAFGRPDAEAEGIFLNYVNQADIQYGGGAVVVVSVEDDFGAIRLVEARPTISYNRLLNNATAPIMADPNSFEESLFRDDSFTADYRRIGPDIDGNWITDNSINGVFIRTDSPSLPGTLTEVTVSARWDDKDIVHVVGQNLRIAGTPGGRILDESTGELRSREDGRLAIDPDVIVKLDGAGIETRIGSQLIAEGDAGHEVVFTSFHDDRYGAGGTFDTDATQDAVSSNPGDWTGLFLGHLSSASLDHALVTMAGGVTAIEGNFAQFNPIEIHQAEVRIANTTIRDNTDGISNPDIINLDANRAGRGPNASAAVFIRGAQPILAANTLRENEGFAFNINVNSLNSFFNADTGRSTGSADRFDSYDDNRGPLVAENRMINNPVNGMVIRGGVLTTESVWEDHDIVHVVFDEISVQNHHTFSGLRLESTASESLVVKLQGDNAGFTATGTPLDIDDRIGGTVQVIGQPGSPVILTALSDDSVGAGLTPDGLPLNDTNDTDLAVGQLPSVGEVDNDTLIDNDAPTDVVGFFSVDVGDGGEADLLGQSGMTARGENTFFEAQDFFFEYFNFVDVGSDGGALSLADTTVNSPALLDSDDVVISSGSFDGDNGLINWQVESRIADGSGRYENVVTFTSAQPLGNLQFINYLDEDVAAVNDDLLHTVGTPGEDDFRAFTLDGPERVGFSQGGVYNEGPGLENATYDGWAADIFPVLRDTIGVGGGGTTYTVPGNINQAALLPFNDPELGDVFGLADVTTAFAWTVDPNSTTATITTFLEAVPENPGASRGEWRSIRLESFSNDRNIETINEVEEAYIFGTEQNATPFDAEFLGELAPNLQSGDDNRRLGFEVHGFIAFDEPGDVDVYSFNAQAGTEVWFDLDRTTQSLDTIVELIAADGTLIASSDNSPAEALNPALLEGLAVEMQRDVFHGLDLYTINPRDAGMRVVLPGAEGLQSTYFVSVRSKEGPTDSEPSLTTPGAYQMQIRLAELDEVPGSTVRYADIRFPANGIEILGAPFHSPLLGSAAESADGAAGGNDTFLTAEDIGNLLVSDRNTIDLAGVLSAPGDVDWYQFTVDFDLIEAIADFNGGDRTWATVFDIDYADGISRPDTTISVFDDLGNLILLGRDSNVSDDQPRPLEGADTENTAAGSFDVHDPFIGSVQLPEGTSRTYFVAIHSNATLPTAVGSTFADALVTGANPLVKFEPIHGLQRIVEDHIGFTGYTSDGIVIEPDHDAILPISSVIELETTVRPFTLSDVTLFVSSGDIDPRLFTVDPFTGELETTVDPFGSSTPFVFRDIVIRDDGQFYGYLSQELVGVTDNTGGAVVQIDPGIAGGRFGPPFLGEIRRDSIPDDPDNSLDDGPNFNTLTISRVDALTYRRLINPDEMSVFPPDERYGLWYSVADFSGSESFPGGVGFSRLFRAFSQDGTATVKAARPQDGAIGTIQSTTRFRVSVDVDPDPANPPLTVLEEDAGDGAVVARISRTGATVLPLTVLLSTSDPTQAVWGDEPDGVNDKLVTFDANVGQIDIPINIIDDAFIDGTQTVVLTATPLQPVKPWFSFPDDFFLQTVDPRYEVITDVLDVTDDEVNTLSVNVAFGSVGESSFRESSGTVSILAPLDHDAEVVLMTGDNSELMLLDDMLNEVDKLTVTIPQGLLSAQFSVRGQQDDEPDGDQDVEVIGVLPELGSATDVVSVVDDGIGLLVLSTISVGLDVDTAAEGFPAGLVTATITRDDATLPELITLSVDTSDGPGAGEQRADFASFQVSMPAGVGMVDVAVNSLLDDLEFTGAQVVRFTAQAGSHQRISDFFTVTDDEEPTISVLIDPFSFFIPEAGGFATATVQLNTTVLADTPISLVNHDPSEISILTLPRISLFAGPELGEGEDGFGQVSIAAPADGDLDVTLMIADTTEALFFDGISEVDKLTVTIPQGSTDVQFTIRGQADGVDDDDQTITIFAVSPESGSASVDLRVTDDPADINPVPDAVTVAIDRDRVVEGFVPGAATATITRDDTTLAQEIILTVDTSDGDGVGEERAAWSLVSVMMGAGEGTVVLPIDTLLDDLTFTGSQLVRFTATAAGHESISDILEVTDDEAPVAVVRAGSSEASFLIEAIDDGFSDNTQFAKITAHHPRFVTGQGTIAIESSKIGIGLTTGMAFVRHPGLSLFAPNGNEIVDHHTFTIADPDLSVTFEFENLLLGNGVEPGNVAIPFLPSDSAIDVANTIRAAIKATALNVELPNEFLEFSNFDRLIILMGELTADPGDSAVFVDDTLPDGGNVMYGVSENGFFYSMNLDRFGQVEILSSFGPTHRFAGLALGPQNLDLNGDGVLGDLARTLFAITDNGEIYAIDPLTGDLIDNINGFDIFADGADHLGTDIEFSTGLAFSALDFNLWHPTEFHSNDPGHGINPSFDNSRDGNETRDISPDSFHDEIVGGASFYFGLESAGNDFLSYPQQTPFGNVQGSTQYGLLPNTINDRILQKQTTAQDRLTEYAVFLRDGGTDLFDDLDPIIRDETIIGDNYNLPGGAHGSLITNSFSLDGYSASDKPTLYYNYFLETENANFDTDEMRDAARVFVTVDGGETWEMLATNNSAREAELPEVPTWASTADTGDARQRVQEMFDTVEAATIPPTLDNTWRQARIDLSEFAGNPNIQLRFDFSTAGVISDPSHPQFPDVVPGDEFGDFNSPERAQDNNYLGFFIDDIIVGFAERGEMVSGTNAGETTFFNVPQDPDMASEVLVGAYQLQIRRGTAHQISTTSVDPETFQFRTFDTNDRLADRFILTAPSGPSVVDGQTFFIDDGLTRVTYEFDLGNGVQAGNHQILITGGETDRDIAELLEDVINNTPDLASTARVRRLIDGNEFTDPVGNEVELFDVADAGTAGPVGIEQFEDLGDANMPHEQGQILIHSNIITESGGFGIFIDAESDDAGLPHTAPTRNLTVLNEPGFVAGLTLENNVVAFNSDGAIRVSGNPNPSDEAASAVPFIRIVNNSLYGGETAAGVGIELSENVSATMLNNIVANFEMGITGDSTTDTSVLGATVYQGNTENTNLGVLGSFPIDLDPADALFVDPASGNFLLAQGSLAIDSSIDSLEDRPEIVAVGQPLGIPESPILAPDRDLFGRVRSDDPTVAPPPGLGAAIFKDRGAIEGVVDIPSLSINDNDEFEGNSGTPNSVVFDVVMTVPSGDTVTVNYTTVAGSATSGVDFEPTAGTLTFTPGQVIRMIEVPIIGDTDEEGDENFFVEISMPDGATIGDSQGEGTIIDDDVSAEGSISIEDIEVSEPPLPGNMIFPVTVSLSAPTNQMVTVDWATDNGTAAGGDFVGFDFTHNSGTVEFAPFQTTAEILVQIRHDTIDEADETFFINLTNPIGATIADDQGQVTIIDDDDVTTFELSINDIEIDEGNGTGQPSGSFFAQFTVSLSAPSPQTVEVLFSTMDLTAEEGLDYTPRTDFLVSFAPSIVELEVNVQIHADLLDEGNETFFANLTSPVNATIAKFQGQATILDDDGISGSGPQVTDVLVSGQNWTPAFLAQLEANGLGTADDGYSIPLGPMAPGQRGQFSPLPYTNIDEITIAFDEDVVVTEGDLEVHGVNVANYAFAPGGFSYDPIDHTATWTLAAPVGVDKLLLILDDNVQNQSGVALDGEWTDGSDTYPSGNNTAGGTFNFRINVLPGDHNADGFVDGPDYTIWANEFGLHQTSDAFAGDGDTNGNGMVLGPDYTIWQNFSGMTLPGNEPLGPESGGSGSGSVGSGLPGDATGDGIVNADDYTVWSNNFGLWTGDATVADGDFTADGIVTATDYTIWAAHFGESLGGQSSSSSGGGALLADVSVAESMAESQVRAARVDASRINATNVTSASDRSSDNSSTASDNQSAAFFDARSLTASSAAVRSSTTAKAPSLRPSKRADDDGGRSAAVDMLLGLAAQNDSVETSHELSRLTHAVHRRDADKEIRLWDEALVELLGLDPEDEGDA